VPLLDRPQQRAFFLIVVLGAGLAVALWPFITGLIGAPVLYVVFAPLHQRLCRHLPGPLAAAVVLVAVLLAVLGPGLSFVAVLASEGQDVVRRLTSAETLERLGQLRLGSVVVAEQLRAAGSRVASTLGTLLLGAVGGTTKAMFDVVIALFGLYYLLVEPPEIRRQWVALIPFSPASTERLLRRFEGVTWSTLVGTGLTAALQGVLVGGALWSLGFANPLFWGVVTVVLSVLPVVGSGLVWAPAAVYLLTADRVAAGLGLALWGAVVVGNVDTVVRPVVFRRFARIHPFLTIVGAIAGVGYFGLLGLVIGPLGLTYFFELIRMYREEYLDDYGAPAGSA